MSETLSGGCLCGDVRYEVDGSPVYVFHCHCSMCRRAGGTAFQTWVGLEDGALTVTQGTAKRYKSSSFATRSFCGRCGGQLFYNYTGEQTPAVWVTVGTLDHPESMTPERHVFSADSVPWLHMADDLPRTEGDPEL
ncbi:MAG: GFA family protein [Rhodospirillales bacterium]|nr:GFA family protein [Rhodospirillales bacterium]